MVYNDKVRKNVRFPLLYFIAQGSPVNRSAMGHGTAANGLNGTAEARRLYNLPVRMIHAVPDACNPIDFVAFLAIKK